MILLVIKIGEIEEKVKEELSLLEQVVMRRKKMGTIKLGNPKFAVTK